MESAKDEAAYEAERRVLGFMCSDEPSLHVCMEKLTEGDFGDERHKTIFRAARNLYGNMNVDIVTMMIELDNNLTAYLSDCIHEALSPATLDTYIRLVKRGRQKRMVREVAWDMLKATEGNGGEPESIVGESIVKLTTITDNANFVGLGDALTQVENERIEEGLPWCMAQLNRITGGLQKGRLICVAGPTSKGKTVLTMQTVQAVAEMGKWVLVFPLEMSPAELTRRMVASHAQMDGYVMRKEQLSVDEQQRISGAIASMRKTQGKISMYQSFTATSGKVEAAARRYKAEGKCDMVVIDYLQLLADKREKGQGDAQRLEGIMQHFKQVAMDLQVPFIIVSQLNRSASKEEDGADLSQLKGSSGIEQSADVVVIIQPKKHSKNDVDIDVQIDIQKNRSGPTGFFDARFRRSLGRFEAV